jgi:hypothetical protein
VFTVREQQINALASDFRRRFHQRLITPLRENLPSQTAGLDDQEMLRRIAAADAKAGRYGIVGERGIAQFAALSLLAGPDFDQRPKTQRLLKDARVEPQHKMDTLFDYLVERARSRRGG